MTKIKIPRELFIELMATHVVSVADDFMDDMQKVKGKELKSLIAAAVCTGWSCAYRLNDKFDTSGLGLNEMVDSIGADVGKAIRDKMK